MGSPIDRQNAPRRARLVALLLALAAPASAQSPFRVDLAAGLAVPEGSAVTAWSPGWTFAAALRVRVASRLRLGLEAGYAGFTLEDADSSNPASPTRLEGGNPYVVPITLEAELTLTEWGNTRPFARLGLGWTRVVTTEATWSSSGSSYTVPSTSDDALGAGLGVGVWTLLTPRVTLFVDATWRFAWVESESIRFVPLRVGVRF